MWFKNILQKAFRKKKQETDFNAAVFPLIRPVHFTSIANELITVQPLTYPTGLLFYMDMGNPNALTRKMLIEKYKNPYLKGVNMDYYSTFNFNYDDQEFGEQRHGR